LGCFQPRRIAPPEQHAIGLRAVALTRRPLDELSVRNWIRLVCGQRHRAAHASTS